MRKAHKTYNIPLGTLSHKLRGKHGLVPGRPTVFSEHEEIVIVDHIKTVAEWGFPFDLTDLRMLVRTYLSKIGRTVLQFRQNLPSSEWAHCFMKRHKGDLSRRQCQNIKRSRASVSAKVVEDFYHNLRETLLDENKVPIVPERIFNYDETNLSDNPGTRKFIFKRGAKYPERIRDSTNSSTSIMFCGSAAGQMLPAYVVYKAEQMWNTWTEGGPKHTRYSRSKSGWFDRACFSDWFETVFIPHANEF